MIKKILCVASALSLALPVAAGATLTLSTDGTLAGSVTSTYNYDGSQVEETNTASQDGIRAYDTAKEYQTGDTTIYTKTTSTSEDTAGGRLLPTVNKVTDDSSAERVLPTVNKATDENSSERVLPTVNKKTQSATSGDEGENSAARVLPTVNKRTTEAKIEVRGWDPEKKEKIVEKVTAETNKNLELNSVEITEDAVDIDYAAPVKLFGFIPMTALVHISAADERVKVKFPWYRFFLRSDYTNIAREAEGVFQNNQTDLEFLKTQGTDAYQFRIFELLSNVLKTKHDTVKNSISNVR